MYVLPFITLLLSMQKSIRMKKFHDTNTKQLMDMFICILINVINYWKETSERLSVAYSFQGSVHSIEDMANEIG